MPRRPDRPRTGRAWLVFLVLVAVAAVVAWRFPHSGADEATSHTTSVVALGDSVPAATACGCGGYVDDLATSLRTPAGPVSVRNLAVPGMDTRGLLTRLRAPDVRAALARADIVVLQIGANDIAGNDLERTDCSDATACWSADLAALGGRLDDVFATVTKETRPGTTVRALGYWNVAMDGEAGRERGTTYVRNSRDLTAGVNRLLDARAARHHVGYVDLSRLFLDDHAVDDLLAADGDHPNAAGHRIIAKAVLNSLPDTYRTRSE